MKLNALSNAALLPYFYAALVYVNSYLKQYMLETKVQTLNTSIFPSFLVFEKGRMTVGLGTERGRRLPLSWGEIEVVEGWLVVWLALVLLGVRLSLLQMELISCLMAT